MYGPVSLVDQRWEGALRSGSRRARRSRAAARPRGFHEALRPGRAREFLLGSGATPGARIVTLRGVSAILDKAAAVGIWRIDLAVTSGRAPPALRSLPFTLGRDPTPKEIETRITERNRVELRLSYDRARNIVDRRIGERLVPAGAAGDELLQTIIRDKAKALEAERDEPHLVLFAEPDVPWQHVISAIDAGRLGRVGRIEFGFE